MGKNELITNYREVSGFLFVITLFKQNASQALTGGTAKSRQQDQKIF